jgi:hypothetical protein
MEPVCSSKTLVDIYWSTWCHIPEESTLQSLNIIIMINEMVSIILKQYYGLYDNNKTQLLWQENYNKWQAAS